jgi:hypothetical protein
MPRHHRKAEKNPSGIWIVKKIEGAKKGDEVTWGAPSDSDITVSFDPGKDPLGVGSTVVNAGTTSSPKTVPPNSKGKYSYKVLIHKDKAYAQGGSDPEIIIVG